MPRRANPQPTVQSGKAGPRLKSVTLRILKGNYRVGRRLPKTGSFRASILSFLGGKSFAPLLPRKAAGAADKSFSYATVFSQRYTPGSSLDTTILRACVIM